MLPPTIQTSKVAKFSSIIETYDNNELEVFGMNIKNPILNISSHFLGLSEVLRTSSFHIQ